MKITTNNPLNRLQGRSNSSTNFVERLANGNWMQRFARFYLVRGGYSWMQNQIQKFDHNINGTQLKLSKPSIFDGFCVDDAVQSVKLKSVSFGLQLPFNMTHSIYEYAVKNFCFEPGYPERFKVDDIRDGHLGDRPVFRALVGDLGNCKVIEEIAQDPILLKIAAGCLGYYPTFVTSHLTWSIVSNLPLEEIKKCYPPATFHYDIAGYNFVTAYFYITDVDLESGPHVMICNSHRNKPLCLLLLSGRHSDETIDRHYGRENEMAIVGQAGFGFFQDPSCFHKLIPPVKHNRLLFQIRYS